ncbi:hypothetical protein AVEN_42744-1 [Araneus ventricosus]|uniref:Uncharacterized protein n=1 Tax=Araneus ventricosus TaxID=182803 RepID=A0A4Y2AE93_ARAVE|nr:hypothetical protein AVEN_42744-1 [Araneus ventricosus]
MVFGLLSMILGFNNNHWRELVFLENTMFGSLQSISFFAVTYFASNVGEEDEVLRAKVKDFAYQLSLTKNTYGASKLLSRFIESKRRLFLTALGVFKFTKSLCFTSAGVVITYNLLILTLYGPPKEEQ